MALLFFECVGKTFAEGFGGVGEGSESVCHDFYGKEFMARKTVEADGAVVGFAVGVEGRDLLFFRMLAKAHAGRAGGFIKDEGQAGREVGEFIRAEEFFFERIRT